MARAVLGIIGGSGVYDLPGLTDLVEERIGSPWGAASDLLRRGMLHGREVVFLPRHGRGHVLSPSDINYRANIDVMKRAGVTDLVAVSACGTADTVSHGQDGLLTSERLDDFAGACSRLCDDRKLRLDMSEEAGRSAQSYSIERYTNRLVELYREAARRMQGPA